MNRNNIKVTFGLGIELIFQLAVVVVCMKELKFKGKYEFVCSFDFCIKTFYTQIHLSFLWARYQILSIFCFTLRFNIGLKDKIKQKITTLFLSKYNSRTVGTSI